jgi:hypothetical protein
VHSKGVLLSSGTKGRPFLAEVLHHFLAVRLHWYVPIPIELFRERSQSGTCSRAGTREDASTGSTRSSSLKKKPSVAGATLADYLRRSLNSNFVTDGVSEAYELDGSYFCYERHHEAISYRQFLLEFVSFFFLLLRLRSSAFLLVRVAVERGGG